MHTQYLPNQGKQNVMLPCLTEVKQELRIQNTTISISLGYILYWEDFSFDIFLHL